MVKKNDANDIEMLIKNAREFFEKRKVQMEQSKYKQLILNFSALFAGVLLGIILKYTCPDAVIQALIKNLLSPVTTMFLNALKVIVGPLVFFSIASSIADFGDMKSLGRIAGKVITGYSITSFIAIGIGALVWFIFPIGDPSLKALVSDAADSTIANGQNVSTSVLDEIIDIVPSEIVSPFLKEDMLQIIFLAVLMGVAVSAVADKLHVFKDIISDGYLVCSRITTIIINIMPLAIFCSMAKMVFNMEIKSLLSVFVWVPVIYLGDIMMLGVYSLIIMIFARLNPITFFKKYYPTMVVAFTLASSNAALPTSMETCGKSLGISKKIYAFSLPLGATINMDGSCVTLMLSSLFMAKIYGISITPAIIMQLVFSIYILSVGAPGVPGAALICLSLLVPQIGVPSNSISIVMGLYALVGMMQVLTNVTGDAVVTLAVARGEKLVDVEKFKA